jgi:predicted nuclease with TOPRIM domain
MKWLAKLQQNNIEESKLGKKITAKINEYKEVDGEIKQLESDRSQISSEDLEEFDNDLKELKDGLSVLENDICSEVDKYITNIPMNQERARKMQEGKKAKAEVQTPPTPQTEPTPQPEKKTGIGGLLLGLGLVILTGGIAAKYLRNK